MNDELSKDVAVCFGVLLGLAFRALIFAALVVLSLWIAKAAIALGIAPALW